ncbi:MAG: glycosyltransferase [Actinomycetota bacterium]|nr:glycosyltransferase [Actinomycetota bacterium]
MSLLSFVRPGEDHAAALRATREYCDEVVAVENDRYGLSGADKRRLQLKSLASAGSYAQLMYRRPALQAALDRMVQRTTYDIITVEFCWMAHYRFPRATKLVLDEHNIEYDILYRTFRGGTGLGRKLYNYVEYRKLRREERAVWRKFDGCALTSVRDQRLLCRDVPAARTVVAPNGVDTHFFRPGDTPPEPMTLVFFGAIDYYPNTDGVLFFLREVLPRLKQRYPALKLLIVGPSPPEAITRWAGDDIAITGFVEDVRPYLARGAVIIVPLRIGGGTRLKIVEAMAMGKAIVSTTLGAEGIDVTDEQDILLADSAAAFAAQVGRLLDDPALARRLGAAARRLVERRYDWHGSVRKLEGLCQGVLAGEPA